MTAIFLPFLDGEGRGEGVFEGHPCLVPAAFQRGLRSLAPRPRPHHPGPVPEGEGEVVLPP